MYPIQWDPKKCGTNVAYFNLLKNVYKDLLEKYQNLKI